MTNPNLTENEFTADLGLDPALADRICYLVTEVPHNWREIGFRIPRRGYALTAIGLKRQLNRISRVCEHAGRMAGCH